MLIQRITNKASNKNTVPSQNIFQAQSGAKTFHIILKKIYYTELDIYKYLKEFFKKKSNTDEEFELA